ncbi:hypothetical protein EQH94_16850 (plasmid) [Lactiplantibacillus plantarum]|uniref:CHAP domain-containing protein n=1 Tax=Lactiplantibacillus plantarum TaxID=1590 RepID=UPI000FF8C235|nr:CHAP domain-containing protein [Lactiplantibacillus plantarum]QAR77676.1 hypothetical protein EQH94_16850 [Lactiplantibacillus plantarum]
MARANKAGYKVPLIWLVYWHDGERCYWGAPLFESHDKSEAKAGDIVIMNQGEGSGNNGHTAILTEDWHGNQTRIIESGVR